VSERPPPLRERVELPGRGRLELRVDERRLLFVPKRGEPRGFDAAPICDEPGGLARAVASDGRSALLGRHRSDHLYVFDAEAPALRPVPGFERLRGSEELRLHAIAGGYLVVCENGVAALDEFGRTRWRMDAVTFGWRLLAEADGVLWLSDASGNVLGIDATTGRETEA